MTRPTTRRVLLFAAAAILLAPLAWFYAKPLVFWGLVAFTLLDVGILLTMVVAPIVNRARFGHPKTLDEILSENDPVRRVQLLRCHLGWSPGKIAAELNDRGILNDGLPWREDEIRTIARGIW